MKGKKRNRYPQFLAEIAMETAQKCEARGIEEAEAMTVGLEVVEFMRQTYGGMQLYCPRGNRFAISKRNSEMLSEFDGNNARELATKYEMTLRHFYTILAGARADRAQREKEGRAR